MTKGLSADQVFPIALLKNIERLTYDQLVFYLEETMVYRTFCNIGFADKIPSRSSLAPLMKSISPEVWEDLQVITVNIPEAKKIDSGKKVYKKLWKFRAGVAGLISWLKRVFSLDECSWKSHRSYKSYV